MTVAATALEVPNSLLYVRDPALRTLPEIDGLTAEWHTPSCVAISCLPDSDGPTTIAIGPSREVGRDKALVFDHVLDTPSRELIIEIVPGIEVLRVDVPRRMTRVRIRTNGNRDTDNVIFGLD